MRSVPHPYLAQRPGLPPGDRLLHGAGVRERLVTLESSLVGAN